MEAYPLTIPALRAGICQHGLTSNLTYSTALMRVTAQASSRPLTSRTRALGCAGSLTHLATTCMVVSMVAPMAAALWQPLNSRHRETLCNMIHGRTNSRLSSSSSITTYKLPLTSSTEALQQVNFTMDGEGTDPSRQDAPHPHSTFTDPTGRYLIVPDLGADLVRIFAIDASTGKLTACTPGEAGAGDGPRHGAWWSPNSNSTEGLMLYTVNELSNSISAWSVHYPASAGGCLSLEKAQIVPTVDSNSSSSSSLAVKAAEVHVRDNFLYAANRNDQTFGLHQDSLVTYNISSTGVLDFVETTNAHSWYPRSFSISEEGDLIAVGGQTSSNVAIIERNNSTGRLGGLLASIDIATQGNAGQEDGLSAVIWKR